MLVIINRIENNIINNYLAYENCKVKEKVED